MITAAVLAVAFWALSIEIRTNTRAAGDVAARARSAQRAATAGSRSVASCCSRRRSSRRRRAFQYDLNIYRGGEERDGKARVDLVNTVEEELRNRLHNVQADLLVVTDDSGRVFAAAARDGATVPRGTSLLSLKAVQRALDPTARADTGDLAVLRTDAGHLEVAVYPLVQAGYTLGSLVLGRRLDSAFLVTTRAESDPEVVLTTGNRVAARERSRASRRQRVAAQLEAHARDPQAASVRLGNEDFVVAPLSLGETQDHEPVHLWMLQPLTRRVAALTRPLRRLFLLYGALAVIVAAFGSAVVARTVLGPFQKFVRYMRSGAATETATGAVRRRPRGARGANAQRVVQPADGFAVGKAARARAAHRGARGGEHRADRRDQRAHTRRARAARERGAAPPVAEARGHRHAGRRHRARFQ